MPIKWKPIEEVWLRSQERFALGFKGRTPTKIDWIWYRVLDREYKNATPYTKSFNAIAKQGGTTTFALLKDGDDEVLDVGDDFGDRIIYHAGLGIKPVTNDLRVYSQFPQGTDLHGLLGGFDPLIVGNDFGYVTSLDSPFDAPTEALEFWVPWNYTVAFAFSNEERVAESGMFPSINVSMMAYLFEVLWPNQDKETDLLLSQMARGTKKCRYKVIGSVADPAQITSSYLEKIGGGKKTKKVPITLETARKLTAGGA